MRQSARMKIVDPNAVLTVSDKRQLERMICQQLEFVTDKIAEVQLMIEQRDERKSCNQFPISHLVSIEAHLVGGKVVHHRTTRVSKGAALMVAIDHLSEIVRTRMNIESSCLRRWLKHFRDARHSLIASFSEFFNRSSGQPSPKES